MDPAYSASMKLYCKKSCDYCAEENSLEKSCRDQRKGCSEKADRCDKKNFRKRCPETCGLCDLSPMKKMEQSQPCTDAADNCDDFKPFCFDKWESLKTTCAKTCGFCS